CSSDLHALALVVQEAEPELSVGIAGNSKRTPQGQGPRVVARLIGVRSVLKWSCDGRHGGSPHEQNQQQLRKTHGVSPSTRARNLGKRVRPQAMRSNLASSFSVLVRSFPLTVATANRSARGRRGFAK